MNTKDRNGNDLPTTLGDTVEYTWSARVAATNGVLNSKTGWTYYEIPAESIVQRSRSTALDEGTWQLTLSVLAEALPSMVEPLAYYQLEIDLVDDTGAAWPYHTGPIDSVEESWVLEDGALVRVYEIQSFGTLQRTKGLFIASLKIEPFKTAFTDTMTCFAEAHYVAIDGPFTAGATYEIPGTQGGTVDITVGTGNFPGVVVDNNSDFSSPLVYTTDYTITDAAGTGAPSTRNAAYIKFVANQTGTFYIRFFAPAYWGILQNSPSPRPAFIRIPPGNVTFTYGTTRAARRVFDDFATYVSSATTTAITVDDPEPFKSGNATVKVTGGPAEYLEWVKPDGTTEVREISSTSAAGVITVSAFTAAPAAGDLVRLVTSQSFRAWDRHNQQNSGQFASNPVFKDGPAGTDYPRGMFDLYPQAGVMRITQTRHWLSASDQVYADTIYYMNDAISTIGTDNRLESAYKVLLDNSTQVYAVGDLEFGGPLLSWIKNFSRSITTLDKILDDFGEDGLPPNGYIHDRPSGALAIGAYKQKSSPDLVMSNVIGVQIGALPEPVTQVVVRSVGEEKLITHELEPELGGSWTNGFRLFDGNDTSFFATATSGATVTFKVRPTLNVNFPPITKIEILGVQGVVEVYGEQWDNTSAAVRSRQLEGMGYRVISEGKPVIIEREELEDLFVALGYSVNRELRIILKFHDMELFTTLQAQVYEIKAYRDIEAAWSAQLTDSTTGGTGSMPTGWDVINDEGFGPFYWQKDLKLTRSWRYATPEYLKRVSPIYALGANRTEVVDLTRINQVECRRIAESYLDEYIRQGRTYTVSAILDPRVDLGDTVNVTLGDGSSRDLFVWAISDSGGREDFQTTYTLLDYAA